MAGGVTLTGLDELMRFLSDAPTVIRAEARTVVEEETRGAASDIKARLGVKTGTLRKRVKTVFPASGVLVGQVLSTAPHSHLYEFGTQRRQTKRYGNRAQAVNRGRMPADKVTPEVARARRARMHRRLKEIVERHGFTVTEV